MAFKMTQKPTFAAAVVVNVANDKGGFDKNTFTAVFKRYTTAELLEMRNLPNDELISKVMTDWDLKDAETNEAVPFTTANVDAVLQVTPAPMAIAMAFWESVNGARSKN